MTDWFDERRAFKLFVWSDFSRSSRGVVRNRSIAVSRSTLRMPKDPKRTSCIVPFRIKETNASCLFERGVNFWPEESVWSHPFDSVVEKGDEEHSEWIVECNNERRSSHWCSAPRIYRNDEHSSRIVATCLRKKRRDAMSAIRFSLCTDDRGHWFQRCIVFIGESHLFVFADFTHCVPERRQKYTSVALRCRSAYASIVDWKRSAFATMIGKISINSIFCTRSSKTSMIRWVSMVDSFVRAGSCKRKGSSCRRIGFPSGVWDFIIDDEVILSRSPEGRRILQYKNRESEKHRNISYICWHVDQRRACSSLGI